MSQRQRLQGHILRLVVPAGWNELTPRSFATIARLLHRNQGDALAARVAITWHLLGIRWWRPRRVAALFLGMDAMQRHTLLQLATPFMEPAGLHRTLVPTLRCGWRTLHVCHTDLLHKLDAECWGLADTYFMRFNERRDPELLRNMAAVLYAPKGMPREERLQGRHLPLLRRCTLRQLLAMHLMWSGHRHHLQQVAPWVFRPAKQQKAASRKGGWDAVLRSMSGSKFGPYSETKLTPARTFLAELSDALEQDQKRREELQRMQRKAGAR
jgi:hypothetical protein